MTRKIITTNDLRQMLPLANESEQCNTHVCPNENVANSRRTRRIINADNDFTPTMTTTPIPGLVPTYEDYARCVHCGLGLNACPTYRLWNLEADSPRGRIRQMVSVEQAAIADPAQKAVPITAIFVDHIDKCLDCRACETACHSGVHYGKLVEYARARIERDYQRPFFSRLTRNFVFQHLLPYPRRIATAARLLRVYQ